MNDLTSHQSTILEDLAALAGLAVIAAAIACAVWITRFVGDLIDSDARHEIPAIEYVDG